MPHAIWKLTALAGVVGIGLLVVMQAQQGLKNSGNPLDNTVEAASQLGESELPDGAFHSHRDGRTENDTDPVPASAKNQRLVGGTDTTATRVARNQRSTAADDPFAEVELPAEPVRQLPASARLRSRLEKQQIAEQEALLSGQKNANPNPRAPRLSPGSDRVEEEESELLVMDSDEQADVQDRGVSGYRSNRDVSRSATPSLEEEEDSALAPIEEEAESPETLIASNTPPRRAMAREEEEEVIEAEEPVVEAPAPSRSTAARDLFEEDAEEETVRIAPPAAAPVKRQNVAVPDPLPAFPEEGEDDALKRHRLERERPVVSDPLPEREPEVTISAPAEDGNFAAPMIDAPSSVQLVPPESARTTSIHPANRESAPKRAGARGDDDDADFGTRPTPKAGPQLSASQSLQDQSPSRGENQYRQQDSVPVLPPQVSSASTSPAAGEPDALPGQFRDDDGFPRAAPSRSAVPKLQRSAPAPVAPAPALTMASHATDAADFAQDPPARAPAQNSSDNSRSPERIASVPLDRTSANSARPHLTIDKLAPASAPVNHPLVYQIVVRNAGSVPAGQVVVEDRVPHGVQLTGTIPQAHLAGDRLSWQLGNVSPGQEKKISVRIVPTTEGVVGSVATVSFAADLSPQTLVTAPKLRFDLLASPQATLGAPVLFTFRVTNTSRSDATGVFIRNVLPAGLRHPDGDDLEFEVGTLAPGKSREVQLALNAAQVGRTVNRAVVTGDGGISVQAEAEVEIRAPGLTIVRTGPKRLFLNKSGVFINRVTNAGSTPLVNVKVVETVPAGLQPLNATSGSHFDQNRRTITWTISRLDARQSVDLDVRLNMIGRGPQVSVVRASDASGATGEAMSTVSASGVAALGIEISEIPLPVETGERVNCRVRVVNRGSEPASTVRTTIVLPHGMQLVSAQGATRYTQSGDQLSFEAIEQLNARGETTIDLVLQGRQAGDGRLQVTVQCDQMSQALRRDEATSVVAPH